MPPSFSIIVSSLRGRARAGDVTLGRLSKDVYNSRCTSRHYSLFQMRHPRPLHRRHRPLCHFLPGLMGRLHVHKLGHRVFFFFKRVQQMSESLICQSHKPPASSSVVRAYRLEGAAAVRVLHRKLWFMHHLFRVPGDEAVRHAKPVQALVRARLADTSACRLLRACPHTSYSADTECSVWINFGERFSAESMRIVWRILVIATDDGFEVIRMQHLDRVCAAVQQTAAVSCALGTYLGLDACGRAFSHCTNTRVPSSLARDRTELLRMPSPLRHPEEQVQ